MSTCSQRLRFLVSLVVVVTLLVPPAVSVAPDPAAQAQIVEVAASCKKKCQDLCAALPKGEDPFCDQRCDSISSVYNSRSVKEQGAVEPLTATMAVQEIQTCHAGCSMRCIPEGGLAGSCNEKCADTFRPFGPAFAALGKVMEANDLGGPAKLPRASGKDDFKFEACSDACNRKCAAWASKQAGGNTNMCGGSCAEACGLYRAANVVLQDAMPAAAVPSPAAVADDTIANTSKACNQHCAAKDDKCARKCSYACYFVTKAKATMKLATGNFGLPA